DRADLVDNVARVANRAALDAEIAAVFAGLAREAVVERLAAAQIAYGAVNSVADLAGHPQLRKMDIETPAGPLTLIAPPAEIAGEPPRPGPVPGLDAHGAAIRAEFGN